MNPNAQVNMRQSPEWEKYFAWLGWHGVRLSNDAVLFVMKIPFGIGSFIKMQRPPLLSAKDIKEIDKTCLENKALFIKLEPSFDQDVKLLEKTGYIKSPSPLASPSILVMDLTKSEKELWDSLSHSVKYGITRAKREGAHTVVHTNPSKELLKEYFNVLSYTGRTKKFYVQPFNDLLKRSELFKSYLAFVYDKDNNLAGGKFYITHEDTVLYLNGGTSHLGRLSRAGYNLMWESILYFKREGFKLLDLDGVDDERFPGFTKDWGGFSHFKERFGGEIIRYPYPYIKYYSSFLKKFLPAF